MDSATAAERHGLDAVLLQRMRATALPLAALLLVLALTKPWAEPTAGPRGALLLAAWDLLALAAFVSGRALIDAGRIEPRHANATSFTAIVLLVLDATMHSLVLGKSPGTESITFVLLMVGSAVFFTRTAWFAGAVGVVVVALVALSALTLDDPIAVAARLGVHLLTAASVAAIMFAIHNRTMLAAERSRALAEERAQRAESLADDLRASGAELEAFAYTAAHDLRAPLRAIHAHTEALAERPQPLTTQERYHLSRIAHESERLGLLVRDLLDLAHIGRDALGIERVDVSAMAREVAEALALEDEKRRVDVRIAPGLETRGDPGLLRSVLENLMGNAWKFTRLRSDARIDVGEADTPAGRALYVRDNGIGFAPSESRALFRPFRRLANAAGFEGSGVGLASVEHAVRRHGGRVWAEAKPGEGATFYFTLAPPPRAEPPIEQGAEPAPIPRPRHAWRARRG